MQAFSPAFLLLRGLRMEWGTGSQAAPGPEAGPAARSPRGGGCRFPVGAGKFFPCRGLWGGHRAAGGKIAGDLPEFVGRPGGRIFLPCKDGRSHESTLPEDPFCAGERGEEPGPTTGPKGRFLPGCASLLILSGQGNPLAHPGPVPSSLSFGRRRFPVRTRQGSAQRTSFIWQFTVSVVPSQICDCPAAPACRYSVEVSHLAGKASSRSGPTSISTFIRRR